MGIMRATVGANPGKGEDFSEGHREASSAKSYYPMSHVTTKYAFFDALPVGKDAETIRRQGTCFLVFGTGIHGMGKREELYGTHQRRHSTGGCRWPPNSNGDIPHHFSTTVAYRLRKSTVCVRSLSCNSVSDGGVP